MFSPSAPQLLAPLLLLTLSPQALAFLPSAPQPLSPLAHHRLSPSALGSSGFLAPQLRSSQGPRLPRAEAPQLLKVRAGVDLYLAAAPALQFVSGTATKISGAAVLCGVIAFHEAGHFLAAKVQGIKVSNFNIGFGPQLFGFKDKDGVEYSFRALPLGGYVSFPDGGGNEDEESESGAEGSKGEAKEPEEVFDEDDPDLIQNRPALQRALVISGGVIFNMILAWGAIAISVSTNGVSNMVLNPGVAVPEIVDPQGAGARFGLQPGDVILKVNGKTLIADKTSTYEVVGAVRASRGEVLQLTIDRKGSPFELDLKPDTSRSGEGIIGVRLGPSIAKMEVVHPSGPLQAIEMSNKEFGRLLQDTTTGFVKIVSNLKANAGNLAGPVGVMQMGSEASKQGALLTFAALISVNLGLMNALPLPALDGGQLVLVMVEAVRGRPLNQEVTRNVNGVFLTILLGLSLTLLLGDLERLLP